MKSVFVEGLSNHDRFLGALKDVEHRGAREAGWVLVEGDPGYGKSATLLRHAIRMDCPIVRAKADWTPRWALTDVADALNVQRSRTTQSLADAVLGAVMEKQATKGFCLIVDEIDHAARNIRVLESLRDITDMSECVLIAGGMKGISARLKAHRQIHSRIDQFIEFTPATVDDVRKMCNGLSEVPIAEDLVDLIHARTRGRIRLVRGCIARVEAFGKKTRGAVTLASWGGRKLLSDDRDNALMAAE